MCIYVNSVHIVYILKQHSKKKQKKNCAMLPLGGLFPLGLDSFLSFPYLRAGLSKGGGGSRLSVYTPGLPVLVADLGLARV